MKKSFYIILLLIISFFILSNVSNAQRLKFYEAFDSLNVEDRGWKLINNDNGVQEYPAFFTTFDYYQLGTLAPHAGNYFIKFNSLNANEKGVIDEWVILPQITDIEKYDTLSFWCGAVDKKYKDSIRVYVSITDNNISSFQLLDNFKVDGPAGNWHKKSYSLKNYIGQKVYFAINYYLKNGGPYGTSSDNIWMGHFSVSNPFGKGVEAKEYKLAQNFPNPFNPSTDITFSIPAPVKVTLKVYDLSGKEVAELANSDFAAGNYLITFNAGQLASGVYFYKLKAGSFTDTKKMVLLK